MQEWVDQALLSLEGQTRLRKLLPITPLTPVRVSVMGRETLLFSSNDYLGLSQHSAVKAAASGVALERGMGTRGASLICGYSDLHQALEQSLADLKKTQGALLFPTGYQANVGILSALASNDTVFFSDQLNHASIIDGIRLSRCPVHVYRHLDMDHLESCLSGERAARKVIVSDALFSMDGDLAPVAQLAELKIRYGATLILDEAHSTLLYGPNGAGLAAQEGVSDAVDFHVGTLSKAVGAQGGFVATSQKNRQWLFNSARSFIFTTALPAPVVAAAQAALDVSLSDSSIRERLWERIAQLSQALDLPMESPIVPIIMGEESLALSASRRLLEQGFHVTAIRPPTVPQGSSRLRIALCAEHSRQDVDDLVAALSD
jgi:8-amino-7-oxononanoate synthase